MAAIFCSPTTLAFQEHASQSASRLSRSFDRDLLLAHWERHNLSLEFFILFRLTLDKDRPLTQGRIKKRKGKF